MSVKMATPPDVREVYIVPPSLKQDQGSANLSMDSGVAGMREHVSVNNNDLELPEYIVDPSTRTTYLKGKFLGKGGFARVHELTDLTTNTVYAGKIIPKSRITKPHHKEKIAREIDLHRYLIHKHVVRFHHCFEDRDNVYILLENCPRKSLVHVLKHRKTLTEAEVRYYLHQLVEGVSYIHQQRVIHRDLKLGNMFLSDNMYIKIGDFGLAARLDGEKKVTICGTPNYIAPEVLNKYGHGTEADVWAIGCIMYAMLCGQPPFETSSLKETYDRITANVYTIPPYVSIPARDLISKLLLSKASKRPRVNEILHHDFFTQGYMPQSLSPSCCSTAPKFPSSILPRPASQPLEHIPSLTNELRKITSSVSSLRLQASKTGDSHHKPSLRERLHRSQSLKDTSGKKEKDHGFQSSFRQKLSSVLGSDKTTTSTSPKPRPCTAASLYQVLAVCLRKMPESRINPPPVNFTPLFISKWIDYSNKYGFGFQLSDRSVGVLFNDSTRIAYMQERQQLEFHDPTGKITAHPLGSVPPALQERHTLLRYFAQYMDENLTDGGDFNPQQQQHLFEVGHHPVEPIPHMKRWVRTPRAIIMQLTTGTLQINFFKDHTKIIISGDQHDYFVTYINEERQNSTYHLSHLSHSGSETAIRERLTYALPILQEFAELDGEEV